MYFSLYFTSVTRPSVHWYSRTDSALSTCPTPEQELGKCNYNDGLNYRSTSAIVAKGTWIEDGIYIMSQMG